MPTRRKIVSALLGLGTGTALCGAALNSNAWLAYKAVEEAWIRDRHALVLDQCPECAGPAAIDLELKLTELQRRGFQFEYMSKRRPEQLRGGMWQLSWIPLNERENGRIFTANPNYREYDDKIRRLGARLRNDPHYDHFLSSQTRTWKTPQYRSIHRRYSGRLYELNQIYGSGPALSP